MYVRACVRACIFPSKIFMIPWCDERIRSCQYYKIDRSVQVGLYICRDIDIEILFCVEYCTTCTLGSEL